MSVLSMYVKSRVVFFLNETIKMTMFLGMAYFSLPRSKSKSCRFMPDGYHQNCHHWWLLGQIFIYFFPTTTAGGGLRMCSLIKLQKNVSFCYQIGVSLSSPAFYLYPFSFDAIWWILFLLLLFKS